MTDEPTMPAAEPKPANSLLEDASPAAPTDCGDGYFDAAGPDKRDIDTLVPVGGVL